MFALYLTKSLLRLVQKPMHSLKLKALSSPKEFRRSSLLNGMYNTAISVGEGVGGWRGGTHNLYPSHGYPPDMKFAVYCVIFKLIIMDTVACMRFEQQAHVPP